MKITYDKEADALYIELREGEFAKNNKINDYTIVDLDSENNLLGVEILNASERMPKKSFSEVILKNIKIAE